MKLKSLILASLLASALSAFAQPSQNGPSQNGPSQQRRATITSASSTRWAASEIQGTPDAPPPYKAKLALPGIKFDKPVLLTSFPQSDRLVVAEQSGSIYTTQIGAEGLPDVMVSFKDSKPELTAVYGLAFHPEFATNRQVFVTYVKRGVAEGTCVSRFLVNASDPPTIDVASEELLLTWKSSGHNGGCLKFGPDGYLYISTGDAAEPSPPDPDHVGQDLTNLLSSVLRIDVDRKGETKPYGVPADNPFIDTDGARPEIFAYGFRNPWKMNFDEEGNLWVGDVGWELWEMIYRVVSGGNYGWSIMEGPQPVLTEQNPGPTPIRPPTVYHPHSEAASITGGFVYRGSKTPGLQGQYIYGDYQSGILWAFQWTDGEVHNHRVIARTSLQLTAFGEDAKGELYLVDYQGQIFELTVNEAVDESGSFPQRLSETGLFKSVSKHQLAEGIVPYDIVAEAWADYTTAERWLAVPGNATIAVDPKGNWQFPNGSVVVKTVSLPGIWHEPSGVSGVTRRLETQIMHFESGSWRPYTYLWNAEQNDATLAPGNGVDLQMKVVDATRSSGFRQQDYRVAGRKECFLCHNSWVEARTTIFGVQSASLLGVHANQLDRIAHSGTSAGGTSAVNASVTPATQIAELIESGLLIAPVSADGKKSLVDPYDTSADLTERVRSYFHVNCAHCHQFNAGGVATIALGKEVAIDKTKLLGARPAQGTFGIANAQLISPGAPYSSVLLYRVAKTGAGRMPRLGSHHVDETAVRMIHNWIAEMERPDGPDDHGIHELLKELKAAPSLDSAWPVMQRLSSTANGALALATSGTLPSTDPQTNAQLGRLAAATPKPQTTDLFERHLPAAQRRQRLGLTVNYDEILAIPANLERGREIFLSNTAAACKNCHQVGKVGKALGPELDAIGLKYPRRRQLLEHVLEPSKFMEPIYVPYLVETSSGQVITGLLEAKNDKEVAIRDGEDKVHRIPADDVEQIVRQQKSLMPELLLRDLTKQEVADLLAFLSSLKTPPKRTR
jgi:putative heme-binding domain-containing protein